MGWGSCGMRGAGLDQEWGPGIPKSQKSRTEIGSRIAASSALGLHVLAHIDLYVHFCLHRGGHIASNRLNFLSPYKVEPSSTWDSSSCKWGILSILAENSGIRSSPLRKSHPKLYSWKPAAVSQFSSDPIPSGSQISSPPVFLFPTSLIIPDPSLYSL